MSVLSSEWVGEPNLPHRRCPVINAHESHVTTIVSPERTPGYAPLQKQFITKFHRIFSANKCQISGSRARKVDRRKKKNTEHLSVANVGGLHFLPCFERAYAGLTIWERSLVHETCFLLFSFCISLFIVSKKTSDLINYLRTSLLQLLAANRAHLIGVGFGCPDICRHASDTLVVSHK